MIPNLNRVHETRHSNNLPAIHVKHDYFKNSFFPSTVFEWNKLDWKIRNSGKLSISKKSLLNFIRPCANSIFNIHNPYGIKLLTRFRSSHRRCSIRKGVLRNFAKLTGKHLCQSLFLNYETLQLKTLAQVFSCEFCKISKNTFLTEHFWATASKDCA